MASQRRREDKQSSGRIVCEGGEEEGAKGEEPCVPNVICFCTASTCLVMVDVPTWTIMGLEPPLIVSSAAPGQKNPDGGHASGSAEPSGAHSPSTTGSQLDLPCAPLILLDVPPGHGTGVAAPVAQKKPRGQSMQLILPYSFWY